jgi:hypothetical protein
MSTFSAKGTDIDVETIMADIRKKIGEKRKGLYTEEEVREIAEMKLDAVLDAGEFNSDFVTAFRERDAQWNFSFGPETIYASTRGVSGSLIRSARKLLNPILKLLFNPNPVISALSRQADLNRYYVLLLHNMALEMTKMNLEMTHLKARLRSTGIRIDVQSRREKVLEEITTSRDLASSAQGNEGSARRRSRGGRRPWRRRRSTKNGGEDKRQSSSGTQSAGRKGNNSSS